MIFQWLLKIKEVENDFVSQCYGKWLFKCVANITNRPTQLLPHPPKKYYYCSFVCWAVIMCKPLHFLKNCRILAVKISVLFLSLLVSLLESSVPDQLDMPASWEKESTIYSYLIEDNKSTEISTGFPCAILTINWMLFVVRHKKNIKHFHLQHQNV